MDKQERTQRDKARDDMINEFGGFMIAQENLRKDREREEKSREEMEAFAAALFSEESQSESGNNTVAQERTEKMPEHSSEKNLSRLERAFEAFMDPFLSIASAGFYPAILFPVLILSAALFGIAFLFGSCAAKIF